MAIHKLQEEDFEEADYSIIAIHSVLEDFRLAYFINKELQIQLANKNDLISVKTKKGESQFGHFKYEDFSKMITWNLVQNQSEYTTLTAPTSFGLFNSTSLQATTKSYLLPEFKRVDFFLKVDDGSGIVNPEELVDTLRKIDKITTVYTVDKETIKSKNNLIF